MLKKILLALVIVVGVVAITHPGVVLAASKDQVCEGVGLATGATGCTGSGDLSSKIKLALRLFEFVVGTVAIFTMVLGGLRFVTSNGDSGKVTNARNTIMYAAIGIAVAVLSEIIVQFVLTKVG